MYCVAEHMSGIFTETKKIEKLIMKFLVDFR